MKRIHPADALLYACAAILAIQIGAGLLSHFIHP